MDRLSLIIVTSYKLKCNYCGEDIDRRLAIFIQRDDGSYYAYHAYCPKEPMFDFRELSEARKEVVRQLKEMMERDKKQKEEVSEDEKSW
jgi:hypothetical protein